MISELFDEHLDAIEIVLTMLRILMIVAVPLMLEPDADHDGESELVRFVHQRPDAFGVPCADRVASGILEPLEIACSSDAEDDIRLAVADELVSCGCLLERDDARRSELLFVRSLSLRHGFSASACDGENER
jgi:hypothetical protein